VNAGAKGVKPKGYRQRPIQETVRADNKNAQ